MYIWRPKLHFLIIAVLGLQAPNKALAHREDYLDETLVFETLDQGEAEPEYWFDYGHSSESGNNFIRHNLAFEYGITHYWMIDGRTTIKRDDDDSTVFDSGRFETRYRFFEEGTLPIDTAISAEFNVERREDGSYRYGVEPRLILSKDFRKLNLTLNLAEELLLNNSDMAFEVSSGTRYNISKLIRVGSELKYNFNENEGSVIPQFWLVLPHDVTFKTGFSAGFGPEREENFVRFAIELEF